jgi:hypothetical protein
MEQYDACDGAEAGYCQHCTPRTTSRQGLPVIESGHQGFPVIESHHQIRMLHGPYAPHPYFQLGPHPQFIQYPHIGPGGHMQPMGGPHGRVLPSAQAASAAQQIHHQQHQHDLHQAQQAAQQAHMQAQHSASVQTAQQAQAGGQGQQHQPGQQSGPTQLPSLGAPQTPLGNPIPSPTSAP